MRAQSIAEKEKNVRPISQHLPVYDSRYSRLFAWLFNLNYDRWCFLFIYMFVGFLLAARDTWIFTDTDNNFLFFFLSSFLSGVQFAIGKTNVDSVCLLLLILLFHCLYICHHILFLFFFLVSINIHILNLCRYLEQDNSTLIVIYLWVERTIISYKEKRKKMCAPLKRTKDRKTNLNIT